MSDLQQIILGAFIGFGGGGLLIWFVERMRVRRIQRAHDAWRDSLGE